MATYNVNGKDYELKLENISETIWPHLQITLETEDGEKKLIYDNNLDKVDGCPEWNYAGGGMFWDKSYYDGFRAEPKRGATKISPAEWCRQTAIESADSAVEQVVCFPADYECETRDDMITQVSEWLTDQFETLFSRGIDSWVENRLAEEKEKAEG